MKKYILALFLMLSGCTMIDAYFMAHFDSNEYLLIDDIRSVAEISPKLCENKTKMDEVVNVMFLTATKLKNYSRDIPSNEKIGRAHV